MGAVFVLCSACGTGTLDDAYDHGGAGAGRTISADAGAVQIAGSDGLLVEGTTTTTVLTITGGADIAERFEVAGSEPVSPGHVVVIDEANPPMLRLSDRRYDRRVAGVIAGAGTLSPGVVLSRPQKAPNEHYVALAGVVYVLADASEGSIRAGDLLTTSKTAGHAMRVMDYEQASGAILGKAMEPLEQGRGLVLVLVSLQ
jgi:hypothetical protein